MSSKIKNPISSGSTGPRAMPWVWVSLAFVVVLALWVGGDVVRRRLGSFPTEISPTVAYEEYKDGRVFFLDVRRPEAYVAAHLPDSLLTPLDQLKWRLGELPKDDDIVIICVDGERHAEALNLLRQAGFPHTACLQGGVAAWEAAGYPVVKP